MLFLKSLHLKIFECLVMKRFWVETLFGLRVRERWSPRILLDLSHSFQDQVEPNTWPSNGRSFKAIQGQDAGRA